MKKKIVFILCVLFAANAGYSEVPYCPVPKKDSGYVHNGQLMPKCTENDSPEIWSGSWEDLQIISGQVEAKFEFETRKHLGRNIASLVPSSLQQMKEHIQGGGQWGRYVFDAYHEPKDAYHELKLLINPIDAILMDLIAKTVGGRVEKYTNLNGDEVVYDKESGKIILDEKMGTKNFGKSYEWIGVLVQNAAKKLGKYYDAATILRGILKYIHPDHDEYDVKPHKENDQYKYAGILFESDSDGRFYIIDGQTGKRMTKKQVEDFPTTFSDMWKDKGLVCVESDAIDIVPPKENRQSAQNASSEVGAGAVKGNVAKTDADEAKDSNDKGKAPESITVEAKDDGGVGVRGWCKCVNNDDDVIVVGFGGKTSKASYTDEEHKLMRSRFKASRFHSYVYFICRQCGRCSTKGKLGGDGPLKNLCIFDSTLAEQFEDEKKKKVMSDSDYRQHNAMMIRVNQKLLAIPEGQIVIPGSCFCLKPDLITVGLATSDKFQVCRYCGWKWVSAKK